MKVIVCLDDRGGMMFNRRRQSRDRMLIENLVSSLGGERLCISPYSAPLFEGCQISPRVSERFLTDAEAEDVCFVEDRSLQSCKERIDSMVIYRWNRHYPADLFCDLDPLGEGFRLTERVEFAGSSHETITKETYQK